LKRTGFAELPPYYGKASVVLSSRFIDLKRGLDRFNTTIVE